jgi:hypothetical protein
VACAVNGWKPAMPGATGVYRPFANVQFRLPPAFFQSKLSVVQPKLKPESLDDLLVNAGHYANSSMRNPRRFYLIPFGHPGQTQVMASQILVESMAGRQGLLGPEL